MTENRKPVIIILAEDDDDDALLAEKALKESRVLNKIVRARDGEELMNYLSGQIKDQDDLFFDSPALIFLDLNMPKRDGRECISMIKADDKLKAIPVVVLTTSKNEEDILRSYEHGVNSFITKPADFLGFIDVIKKATEYWFEVAQLPHVKQ